MILESLILGVMKGFLWDTHNQAILTEYSTKELNVIMKVFMWYSMKMLIDENDLNELFHAQKSEGSRAEALENLETDDAYLESFEKAKENYKFEERTGPMQTINKAESHSQENDDSEDEEDHPDQLQHLVPKPTLNHNSSHSLDNLISQLNSWMPTRLKIRNLVAF